MGRQKVNTLHQQLRAALILALAVTTLARAEETPKYLDPHLPIEQRLDDLLPRLTLDEKVKTLTDDWGSAAIPRLKIPSLLKTEGLHSQSYATGSTVFPHAIAMAATFDVGLINKVGIETAKEARLAGIRQSWSPVLDVARDARWGRVEETYGEDPYLVSRMGVAWITGFQSQGMIATPKHFAVHGQPLGGRDSNDTELSDREIRETHFPSFRAAIEEAHAGGLMAAYSTYHGVPCNASTDLLRGVLEQEWGFSGILVSDCGGPEQIFSKHSVASSLPEAAVKSILAGVNMECGSVFRKYLAPAVQDGLIDEAALDEGVRRVLRAKMALGLFENPPPPHINMEFIEGYDTPDRRALARDVAAKSIVLLKNDNNTLPLKKDLASIAIIGPLADDPQIGDYSPKTKPGQLISVLAAVKSHVGPNTKITFAKGCDPLKKENADFSEALTAAKAADTIVLVVGDYQHTTGENNDGATLDLPGRQRDLVQAVTEAAGAKPVILILSNGKPFTLPWEADHIPAILVSWYPGEEGGNATADLLFGDRNPSGRLPITFPRSPGQLPLTYDYKPSGRKYDYYDEPFAPLYRFGHGLSYTTFAYSNLATQVSPDKVDLTVTVTNTGKLPGDEVAQLYLTDEIASVSTPVVRLQGFQRVSLQPGESKQLAFTLTPYQLSLLDEHLHRVVEAGRFRVHIGTESPDIPKGAEHFKEHVGFTNPAQGITGAFTIPTDYRAEFDTDLQAPSSANGGEPFAATAHITNHGNLTDVLELTLFGDNHALETHHFELAPGQSATWTPHPALYHAGPNTLSLVSSAGTISSAVVNVSKVQPKLALARVRTSVDASGKLTVSARGANIGSDPLSQDLTLTLDGKPAASLPISLAPGESKTFTLAYQLPRSGTYKLQLADAPPQQVTAPGAITLALRQPQLYLDFKNDTAQNEVTGTPLKFTGTLTWTDGPKPGTRAFQSTSPDTALSADAIDLYRKPFTLAAWVNVSAFGPKDSAALFGGKAPMGADQDQNGTVLHAGIRDKKLTLSFFGSTVTGVTSLSPNQWLQVAYTYDPTTETGALYLNGKLERRGPMKPYTGPLETVGAAPIIPHGSVAMADILVTRSALSPAAISALATTTVQALHAGTETTAWQPLDAAKAPSVQVSATLPGSAKATLTLQAADAQGNVVDTVSIPLADGAKTYPLHLKAGTQLRARVELSTPNWRDLPAVSAIELSAGPAKALWSFTDDWTGGTPSAAIDIEK